MQVNHSVRRIASLLAFTLALGTASASQAGIIPWVYDVIFGPVHSSSCGYGYGYAPYPVSYARPVVIRSAPTYVPVSYGSVSGCSTCSTSYYAPVSYSYASSGCGSVVIAPSCGPCNTVAYSSTSQGCLSGCRVSPPNTEAPKSAAPTNGKSAWKPPEQDQAPKPNTTVTDDGLGTSGRSPGKAKVEPNTIDDAEGARPASGEAEPTILNRKKAPAKSAEDLFEPPVENAKPAPSRENKPAEIELELENKNPGEAKILRPLPSVNLDAKIAWSTEPQRTRVPFHAKLAKASVARRTPHLDSDWTPVVAKSSGTQLAKK